MPATGGPLTPLLTGFAGHIIGLTVSAGAVYVGESDGTIYSVAV
jgi:hypothetical protein